MLVHQLSRIPEFSHVSSSELKSVAARARVLCLPDGRWLARNHTHLGVYLYLLHGSLRCWSPDRSVVYQTCGKLAHFYPGCRSAQTVSGCQVLSIDAAHREFLMQQAGTLSATPGIHERWLTRFLSSAMMQMLKPHQWREIVRAFHRQTCHAKQSIIRQNEIGATCYVIEAGHAIVHQQGQTLCYLSPGDFFGEDALISGDRRNASVTALEDMVIHGIGVADFRRLLLQHCVQPVVGRGDGPWLNVGERDVPGAASLCLKNIRQSLDALGVISDPYVIGGNYPQRELVAFLLRQRGVRAFPVAA